jgi:N-acetylglucosaminylphosphatidylinositol deacetylase
MPTTITTRWPPPDAEGVLLVIAHPDDEAMFFAPAVTAVTGGGGGDGGSGGARSTPPLRLLCLSTGDADGLGQTRARELVRAAQELGVPEEHVTVLDDPRLRDGMRERWEQGAVADAVAAELGRAAAATKGGGRTATTTTRQRGRGDTEPKKGWAVLTFDGWGVSGHPNHRDASRGVVAMAAAQSGTARTTPSNIHSVWQLRSEPLLLKFLGPLGAALGAMLALLLASLSLRRPAAIAVVPAPRPVLASLRAMRLHASQWVWFRWLFVGLSSYGWVNVLERVV